MKEKKAREQLKNAPAESPPLTWGFEVKTGYARKGKDNSRGVATKGKTGPPAGNNDYNASNGNGVECREYHPEY